MLTSSAPQDREAAQEATVKVRQASDLINKTFTKHGKKALVRVLTFRLVKAALMKGTISESPGQSAFCSLEVCHCLTNWGPTTRYYGCVEMILRH